MGKEPYTNAQGDTFTTQTSGIKIATELYADDAAEAVGAEFNTSLNELRNSTYEAIGVTATVDGLTTGIIAGTEDAQDYFVVVTSAGVNNIVTLPTPTPGRIVRLRNAGTGYEIRSSDPTTIAINGGTGAAAESAVAANVYVELMCTTATAWIGRQYTTAGVQSAVEVAAP